MLHENSLVYLLGGTDLIREKIKSAFDLITLSNQGIKKASLDALVSHMGMTKKSFAEDILNLSVKTLERKKADDVLDKYTSSHVIEVTKVVAHAFEVFEDEEKMQKWLNTPNRALNQMKPLDLFYIPTGLAMVDNVLGRIEEGVYS
ncbi:putative toxin-antitoxin system antitoxin component (TIGR02293 family) [Pedobacter cryoconitis]|uniref:Putative toxin-antitoxin system antitoxin component (TIGR02293 family) n=1 Tax=Pedobacter cryoconitis TaxID=188932 RepID=A0A7W9DZY2_9SPHI|nr:antitoxin Xre/MbcA/ParS toxin-binding domain-containing protein [Pedobacter cryoconitis]MBB5637476.1 putative toxin-antitoxin system antitoxin component (TIGR02293 family) [Pedobacter cryoconitis]MBB6269903.1 putative toxin-antitoxin system antitoxin component (TIGR02293 family) [Pedobacter cryoconitis]